jgi:exosortase
MLYNPSTNQHKIKVIVLVGNRDFGRCPLASRLPTALWPIAGQTALERLLFHLADQGIKQAVICCDEDGLSLNNSICPDSRLKLTFLNEPLPVGTAGCIRDAASEKEDELLLVLPANLTNPPDIEFLLHAHQQGDANLTVFLNPALAKEGLSGQSSGIYVCQPNIIKHIPKGSYCDLKEGLIPVLLRAGNTIRATTLKQHAGNFRNRQEYLDAVAGCFESIQEFHPDLKSEQGADAQIIRMGNKIDIDKGTRLCGPIVIMDGARIHNGAVIIGPAILGQHVTIGHGSFIVNSVLWDGAQTGTNCQIQRCVIDYHAIVPSNTVAQEKCMVFKPETILEHSLNRASKTFKNTLSRLHNTLQPKLGKISKNMPAWANPKQGNIFRLYAPVLVLLAFFWSYWPNLKDLWKIWMRNDEYSSGLLVPFLAVYILWLRRQTIAQCQIKHSIWGLLIFLFAQIFRVFGLLFMYGSAERLSIVLSIVGLVIWLYGWQVFKKAVPIFVFLTLMLPWPNRIQATISLPLQRWATGSAVFCLEVAGYEIIREGNVIHIGNETVAVAEACNGLRMITAFIVISGLVALLVERKWWEKLIILVSSLPIALLCNTIRLTVTAMAFTVLEGEQWEKIFHDFGGYAMMPVALAAVVAELWLLAKLTIPPEEQQEIVITRKKQ